MLKPAHITLRLLLTNYLTTAQAHIMNAQGQKCEKMKEREGGWGGSEWEGGREGGREVGSGRRQGRRGEGG